MKYIKTFEEFVTESEQTVEQEYNALLESVATEVNEATDTKIEAVVDNLKKHSVTALIKLNSDLKGKDKYGNWNEDQTKRLRSGVRKQLKDRVKANANVLAKIKKSDEGLGNSIEKSLAKTNEAEDANWDEDLVTETKKEEKNPVIVKLEESIAASKEVTLSGEESKAILDLIAKDK